MKIVAGLLWLVTLAACERNAPEIDLSRVQEKLVLTCFISPQDTALSAHVSRSYSLGREGRTEDPFAQPDATVILSDGERSVQLGHQRGSLYQAPVEALPIRPGQTYTLTVRTPGGLAASASCTVPLTTVPIREVLVDSVLRPDQGNLLKYYGVSLDWLDEAGCDNYYSVYLQLRCKEVLRQKKDGAVTTKPFIPVIVYDKATFTDDKGRDGQQMASARGEVQVYEQLDFTDFSLTYRPDVFTLSLWNTDVHLHRYQQSLEEYPGENPFAEPQNLYSNVRGGLGIFAAYNQSTRMIRF